MKRPELCKSPPFALGNLLSQCRFMAHSGAEYSPNIAMLESELG